MKNVREAAELAEFSININEKLINGAAICGDWQLVKIYQRRKLKICVYYSKSEKEFCVVNRGTEFGLTRACLEDCLNNIAQPLGLSWDMKYSILFAEQFFKRHKKKKITFVGHSKGGAEAMANAIVTNCDCIVFNSAVLNSRAYGLAKKREQYTAKILSYMVEGEFLSVFQKLRRRQAGERAVHYTLPAQYKGGKRSDCFNNHTMYAVIKAFNSSVLKIY